MTRVDIAVVQLPIDLQNEIRSGRGTIASGAFGSRAVDALLLAVLLAGAAAAAYGLASAVGVLGASFSMPARWLMLLGGGAAVGLVLGEHARLDIRAHGMTSWIVGSTSLVRVERDVVHVYPAEYLRQDNQRLFFGTTMLDVWYSLPPQEDIAAAIAAAADPAARTADRWRAAAVGRPAPLWRWTPLLHGAGLGLVLAIAVEAGIPHTMTAWDDLAQRADAVGPALAERDRIASEARFADASRGGVPALIELLRKRRPDDAFTNRVRAELDRQLHAQLGHASLDELHAWFVGLREIEQVDMDLDLASAYGKRLAADAPDLDYDALVQRIEEAYQMRAPVAAAYPPLDDLVVAMLHDDETDLGSVADALDAVHGTSELMPKTYKRASALATKQVEAATTIGEVSRLEPFLAPGALRTSYERAFARELRAATLDTIDLLSSRATEAGLDHAADITARANELFAIALRNAHSRADLEAIHVPDVLDSDKSGAQVTARGRALASAATAVEDRYAWMLWLGDDPLAKHIHDQLLDAALHGDLATTRAMAGVMANDDAGLDIEHHLEELCDKAFSAASQPSDVARRLAAMLCTRDDNVIKISGDDEELARRVAAGFAARTSMLLGHALTVEVVSWDSDLSIAVVDDHVVINLADVASTQFRCTGAGQRWACTVEKEP